MTGEFHAADELELSAFNGNLGGQNPSGNWWSIQHSNQMGRREASAHTISVQCRAGSPDLNCCSVKRTAHLGLVAEWALIQGNSGLALNYYGPSQFAASIPSGQRLSIRQTTDYPVSGKDTIRLGLAKPEKFELKLHIPAWSLRARWHFNGDNISQGTGTSVPTGVEGRRCD